MQVLLCTRYASPIYSPRLDSSEPNVEQETGSEIQPIIEPFTAKVEVDLKPSFIGEPDVLDESESEIVIVLIPLQEETLSRPTEVQEPFVEIFVDLSAEPTIELLPFSPAMRVPLSLRLPDTYHPLQIFQQQTESQENTFLMMQSTISPVFIGDDLPRHTVCILLKLPLTAIGLS